MNLSLALILLSMFPAPKSWAVSLSNLELYVRCYTQLTQVHPSVTSVRYQRVAQNQISAAAACLEVLESATLRADGRLASVTPETVAVLTTMHRLHTSFFTTHDITAPMGVWLLRTQDFYDSTSPALYHTRALFRPNTDASSIVTLGTHLRPIRTDPDPQKGPSSSQSKAQTIFGEAARYAPKGELLGVEEVPSLPIPYSYVNPNTTPPTPQSGTVDFSAHFGGGVIGSSAYLQQVFTEVNIPVANGTLQTHRRWSKFVLRDLFARELPVLKSSDVAAFRTNASSAPTFRRSSSCLTCHATMDPLAGTIRGIRSQLLGVTNSPISGSDHGVRNLLFRNTNNKNGLDWPTSPDSTYSFKLPDGVLRYRNYRGQLVQVEVSGLAKLGIALAQQEDFYIALAKRYYRYFLGVDVPIDPFVQGVPTAEDAVHVRNVEAIARRLQQSQRLQGVITDIFSLPAYRDSGFGVTR